jgi:ABC-type Fe3+-hydroxamate transport system substrate-binding protein
MSIMPQRIISLVPSITETLFHLGLGDRVVGRTKFCIHPDQEIKDVPKIGGTKKVNIDKVKALQPDLIIANKEENVKEDVLALSEICEVYVTEILDWPSGLDMITKIGALCHVAPAAEILVNQLINAKEKRSFNHRGKVLYLIWKEPYMTVGGDTFIHQMLELAGYENIMQNGTRYPSINLKDFKGKVDFVFLSSEPYPFQEKHIASIQSMTGAECILVDGELFSWYGSRMLHAFEYFNTLPSIIKENK